MKRARAAVSLTRSVALVAIAGLGLASCSSSGDPGVGSSVSAPPSPSSTVSIPEGVSLTDQGSDLSFGDSATVLFEPDQRRGTVLELTVTKVRKGALQDLSGFTLDDNAKAASYYYVDVAVKNVGQGDVGGTPVPLWAVDDANTLRPPVQFTTSFPTCESQTLPEPFASNASLNTCLVYQVPGHGALDAVSFRPGQEFDPIQWTGEIATPKPEPKKTTKSDKKKR